MDVRSSEILSAMNLWSEGERLPSEFYLIETRGERARVHYGGILCIVVAGRKGWGGLKSLRYSRTENDLIGTEWKRKDGGLQSLLENYQRKIRGGEVPAALLSIAEGSGVSPQEALRVYTGLHACDHATDFVETMARSEPRIRESFDLSTEAGVSKGLTGGTLTLYLSALNWDAIHDEPTFVWAPIETASLRLGKETSRQLYEQSRLDAFVRLSADPGFDPFLLR